jgi:hypothetical protein
MRQNRPKHSELSEEQRRKANARAHANIAMKRGQLLKQPCEKCGSSKAEKHHEDYAWPLDVDWLCRPCHLAKHGHTIAAYLPNIPAG